MFELLQQPSFLLGRSDDIHALAHKPSARLLVLSDSHGMAQNVRAIITHFGAECDALCFCGDGVRDLLATTASLLGNAETAACIPPVIALAQGNGDNASYAVQWRGTVSAMGAPKTQELVAAGNLIFVTHGHWYDVYYGTKELFHAAKREKARVALFGHTHIPYAAQEDGILLLNPGSCARPRRGAPQSCAVVTVSEHGASYQFYALEEDGVTFTAYTPPKEEMSLLWQ